MKLDDTLGQDGRLLRRAQAQLREQATEVQRSLLNSDSHALAGALEALRVLSATLGQRPAGAVLTTEGAWARVRGHLVFSAREWNIGPRVWRLSPQGWVPLALSDLFGEAVDSPMPTGVLAAPLWDRWRQLQVLRHPQVLALIFVTLVTSLGLAMVSLPVTLALWALCLLIWGARRWAVNRWFAAVVASSLPSASRPLPESLDSDPLDDPWN